ncbi:MAG: hypothetical protein ABIR81_02205 [Ginsengibacter sp.]
MKLDKVLVLHLIKHKFASLQGIGTFKLDSTVALPAEQDKDFYIPESAILFNYNPKAGEDEELIHSIVEHTKKIYPLASADLDSFLMLGRQFLNIGKPFRLEGLGTLDKAQTGELVFIAGVFNEPRIDVPRSNKEQDTEVSSGLFNDYSKVPQDNTKKVIGIITGVIILALVSWALYHFLSKASNDTSTIPVNNDTLTVKDSAKNVIPLMPDTLQNQTAILRDSVTDSAYTFRVKLKEKIGKNEALKTFNRLSAAGNKVAISTTDSFTYSLYQLFKLPLSDTAKIKDSLSLLYKEPVNVEVK